jgi:hypothetical protein
MEKEIRKKLCDVCLKMVRKTEAKNIKRRRLLIKLKAEQVSGKIKIRKNNGQN